jgi:stringent starvation protein B
MTKVSTKPYLLRAIYEWCVDQGFTPYLAVSVDAHTRVPMGYVKDGQIVLNISSYASNQLQMGNDLISFQARFNGQVQYISVPVENVVAIYAKENGEGMGFQLESSSKDGELRAGAEQDDSMEAPEAPVPPPTRPKLTRIK